MKIVLIGYSCTYKSAVGAILARRLGCNHADTDALLTKKKGKTPAQIITEQGLEHFRLEENALLATLQNFDGVISCGGGSVCCPNFSNLSQNAQVVWLTASVNTVIARLDGLSRPLSDGKTAQQIQSLIDSRAPLYAQYATVTICTDGKTPAQVATEAQTALEG